MCYAGTIIVLKKFKQIVFTFYNFRQQKETNFFVPNQITL